MELCIGKKKAEHWEINGDSIACYSKPFNFFSKPALEFETKFDDIKHIEIYFTSTPLDDNRTKYKHVIMFEVVLNNGNIEKFDILASIYRSEVKQAVSYIKDHVTIIDNYRLCDLIQSEERIYDGVERIIKEYDLKYTAKKQ